MAVCQTQTTKILQWLVDNKFGVPDCFLIEHKTTEMLSVTSLAHLQVPVGCIMDRSEQRGYTIIQQIVIFQMIIVKNKSDVGAFADLSEQNKTLIQDSFR